MAEPENLPTARHEHNDVTIHFGIFWFGGIVVALGLVIVVAMALFPATRSQHMVSMPVPGFPAPALQSSPRADMAAFLQAELARLNSTGWVDRAHGIAHIPIADAMRKVAREGIAGWPTAQEARR